MLLSSLLYAHEPLLLLYAKFSAIQVWKPILMDHYWHKYGIRLSIQSRKDQRFIRFLVEFGGFGNITDEIAVDEGGR